MFEIIISSDINRKKVFVEIRHNGMPVAEINLKKKNNLQLIIYSFKNENLVVHLDNFIDAINIGKAMLLNSCLPQYKKIP